jgi:hypothetical protein
MEDIDLWRTATTLIKALGFTAAAFDAGYRAKDMRDKDDVAGELVWIAVEANVAELERIGYVPDAVRH